MFSHIFSYCTKAWLAWLKHGLLITGYQAYHGLARAIRAHSYRRHQWAFSLTDKLHTDLITPPRLVLSVHRYLSLREVLRKYLRRFRRIPTNCNHTPTYPHIYDSTTFASYTEDILLRSLIFLAIGYGIHF